MKFYRKNFLFFISFLFIAPLHAIEEKVYFTGQDGVKIVGEFYKPKNKKLTFIFLHGVASVKEEWKNFSQFLHAKGFGVLIYDLRGHGKSIKTISGKLIRFEEFNDQGLESEWGKMIKDLGFAIQFLNEKYGILPAQIAVGGASIGANIAFQYAAHHPEIPFSILLSPGINYQGIKIDELLSIYGRRPLLIAVSPADSYAFQSVRMLQIENRNLGNHKVSLYVFSDTEIFGHGVGMFRRGKPETPSILEEKILSWIRFYAEPKR
ncbi:MAG: alpha/beta fold hydrolase [Elusimicrobia bacterium]|nr:alpha/beta fold hydrolase [Elusimicrobiota bacterium]